MIAIGFALLALSTDMTVASFPGLARHFGASAADVQATLSAFVAAFAVSQLLYGPLSDRFGRRPVLIAAMALYAAASLACTLAESLAAFFAARVAQALGCCAATVIGRAIVRDVHGVEGTARMMSYISAGTALLILAGPIVGGWLEQHFGWRAVFAALTLIGIAYAAALALLLEESHREPTRDALDPAPLLANCRRLLCSRAFLGHALVVAGGYGAVMAFLSGAPFVLMGLLGVPPSRFGVLLGATILGYIATTLVGGRIVMRVGVARMLAFGTPLAAAAGLLMLALAAAKAVSVAAVVLPYALFLIANGINQPSAIAGAIGPHPRIAGTASSLLGFLQLAFGAGVGFAVGQLYDGTPLPMAAAIAASTATAAASFFLIVRRS